MRAASFAGVVPRTPPRSSPHAQTQVMSTPLARGSSSQVDLADNHKVADINTYLEEDIKDRVHLDLEVFLKLVLDFGDAERKKKETKINNVMKNENFERVWNYYRGLCGLGSTTEKELYEPLLKVIETAMKRLFPNQQPFTHFNGGDKFILGSYARRKPDLPALRPIFGLDCQTAEDKLTKVHWPMVEPFGELKLTPKQGGKRTGFALDWADATPGETPQAVTAPATQNRYNLRPRSASGGSLPNAFPTQSHTRSLHSIPETSTYAESKNEEVEAGKKNKKKGNKGTKQKKTLGDEMEPEEENLLTKPSDRRLHTLLQCAGYGLESLSSGLLRTHTMGFVMDGTFFQLCYYDRSKVVLSKPVDLSEPNSMFLFLATLYQLGSLSDEKQGIFPSKGKGQSLPALEPCVNERYTRREGGTNTSGPITGDSLLFPGSNAFSGCKMTVGDEVFHLGELVHRAHAIIGRGTTVVRVKWNDKDAIMKLSFCSADRTSEEELVKSARAKATEDHDWALNHLPNILYSAEYNLAGLAEDRLAKHFEERHIPYERRVLRITVQEVLTPITDAVLEPKDYAQIFFDILQIHRWLVDHAKILHRDISMANIMFREKDGKIYGVLNDFDLSSRLPPQSKASSRQRTGTKPYMSHELIDLKWKHGHRYRHDLESLFYVILIFCSNYGAKGEEDKLVKVTEPHFQKLFTGSFEDVCSNKSHWLLGRPRIPVTEFFHAFGVFYLSKLWHLVNRGHLAKNLYQSAWSSYKDSEQEHKVFKLPFTQVFTETFEWETLNDTVTYEQFRDVMQKFPIQTSSGKWELFELVLHYETSLPLNPSDFGPLPDNETL
ncbi:hypothetical protein D9758_013681 [Tetrapyrgos nigripes]|uniref:Protein kinase domain-containing protein n=1 Tax=Tetrapyrgos nigripes TaxID=182062 RepID=A0A8H5CJQ5_9AGAR|nr:hypothetical protein D9758_013681 [Tetrapyrgos nigripes]